METKEVLKDLRTWCLQERKRTEERLRGEAGTIPAHTAYYDGMAIAYSNVIEKLYNMMKDVSEKGGGRI